MYALETLLKFRIFYLKEFISFVISFHWSLSLFLTFTKLVLLLWLCSISWKLGIVMPSVLFFLCGSHWPSWMLCVSRRVSELFLTSFGECHWNYDRDGIASVDCCWWCSLSQCTNSAEPSVLYAFWFLFQFLYQAFWWFRYLVLSFQVLWVGLFSQPLCWHICYLEKNFGFLCIFSMISVGCWFLLSLGWCFCRYLFCPYDPCVL